MTRLSKPSGLAWGLLPLALAFASGPAGPSRRSEVFAIPSDRLVDWSHAGVPGGIPHREAIHRTLSPGATASDINAAIAAASGGGKVVYLNAGTYHLTQGIRFGALREVTLRGAGPGKTILVCNTASADIQTGGDSIYRKTGVATVGGVGKGATSVTLANAPPSAARVGRLIAIQAAADYDLMWHRVGRPGATVHSHTARITAIKGKTVSYSPPNLYLFPADRNPTVKFAGAASDLCGIEDMTIRCGSGGPDRAMYIFGAHRFWVKGCEITGFQGTAGMIRCEYSCQLEFRRNYIHGSFNYPNNRDGFGIYLNDYTDHCVIEDNIFNRLGCGVLCSSSSGDYVGYNYFGDMGRTTTVAGCIPSGINVNHQAHGLMGLYEGNIASWITNDGYHGSGSHHVLFRNWFNGRHSELTGHRWLITLARGSYYHSVVGNVLGDTTWTPDHYEMPKTGGGHFVSCIYKIEHPNDGSIGFSYGLDGRGIPWENWNQAAAEGTTATEVHFHRHVIFSPDDGYYNGFDVYNGALGARAAIRDYDADNGAEQVVFYLSSALPGQTSGQTIEIQGPEWRIRGTLIRHANYDYYNKAVVYAEAPREIPDSLIYDSKPAWFGTLTWPPIGPDVSGYVTPIPAKWRWDKYISSRVLADLF